MAAYCRVYDSRHLQADCQKPGSAPEPYARQSSIATFIFTFYTGHSSKKFKTNFLRNVTAYSRVIAVSDSTDFAPIFQVSAIYMAFDFIASAATS